MQTELTLADYQTVVGTHFNLLGLATGEDFLSELAGAPSVLTLQEAKGVSSGPSSGDRQVASFSLLFSSDSSQVMEQGTYRFQHADLGELLLFLVPVGQSGDETIYEAVFNQFQ